MNEKQDRGDRETFFEEGMEKRQQTSGWLPQRPSLISSCSYGGDDDFDGLQFQILGGTAAEPGEHPWAVGLYYRNCEYA